MEEPQDVETQEIEKGYSWVQKIVIGVVVLFVGSILLFSWAENSLPDDYAGWYCEEETYLEEEEHYVCELPNLQGDYEVSWTYNHKSGSSNVDIYLLDYTNYQKYDENKSFVFIEELSRENIKSTTLTETTVKLNQDTYYFVVDHSSNGEAQPDSNDEVRIDVRMDIIPR